MRGGSGLGSMARLALAFVGNDNDDSALFV